MNRAVYNQLVKIIYDKSGITLNDNKVTLVSARIAKRMRVLGVEESSDYLRVILEDDTGEEIIHLLDAISTNVTRFLREPDHFELLKQLVCQWLSDGQRQFRFWSAGCSSGEEPYTIGMTVLDAMGDARINQRILATDISTRILKECLRGEYVSVKVKDVPAAWRAKYFEQEGRGRDALFRIKDIVKRLIVFRRLNLSVTPFPMRGPMDAIFCRNVMIYFDTAVRKNLLDEFIRLLKPGGYLFVGHSESLTGFVSTLRCVHPSVYIKPAG